MKLLATLCTAAVLAVGLGSTPGLAASPGMAEFQNAQFSFSFGNDNSDRYDRNDRYRDRDGRFERRGSYYYYNGHRGYENRRSGYRFYNGFWFPQSAFSFGITINPRSSRSMSSDHVAWCEDRYRSYRASDNTFQPYNGGRQECISPYSR
ncbi:MAG: BA14K family protein [Novosphingobium sp.]|jgi:hypothetical protein